MSAETSPFLEPLMVLWGRLNFISGMLFILSNYTDNYRDALRRKYGEGRKDLSWLMCGKSVPITDLTGPTDNGWLYHYPSGGFSAQGEEYLSSADVIVRRESAWVVAQGYEAFETFLKDSLAVFFLHAPSTADSKKLQEFDRRDNCSADRSTTAYWRQFVGETYRGRNNQEILKALRQHAPGLAEAEKDNTRNIDLVKWYASAGAARHAVAHSNMRLNASGLSHIPPDDSVYFPFEDKDGEKVLNLGQKQADKCIETFAEYAFQVFKYLSKATNDEWDILEKGGFRPKRVSV